MALALAAVVPMEARRDQAGAMRAVEWSARLPQTMRSHGPWLVALCFAVCSAQWMSVVGLLPSIYSNAGLDAGWMAVATAAAAAVSIIGNLASGRLLLRQMRLHRLLIAGYVAMGLGAWIAFGPLACWESLWRVGSRERLLAAI